MGRTVTKSIAIIGEGETEWFYFDSLRIACRYPFKVAPDFPQHSDINHILKLVESYLNKQYDYVVCLFEYGQTVSISFRNAIVSASKERIWQEEICRKGYVRRNESLHGILVSAPLLA